MRSFLWFRMSYKLSGVEEHFTDEKIPWMRKWNYNTLQMLRMTTGYYTTNSEEYLLCYYDNILYLNLCSYSHNIVIVASEFVVHILWSFSALEVIVSMV